MNEMQLAESGFQHLECIEEPGRFDVAIREDGDGCFTIALRNSKWIPGDGITHGKWEKADSFYLIRFIRKDLYLSMRNRFAERLKNDLPLTEDWEAFVRSPIPEQLLVIAEHFDESFLWDCQEDPYPLEKLPLPKVMPSGDLDFSETQDFLRARNRNQRNRDFTSLIHDNRAEFEESERILGELWGFDPNESYYGNSNKFVVEKIAFKANPSKATQTISFRLGKAPNGYYSTGVSLSLDRSGYGYGPHVWNPEGYATRDNALLAVIDIAREWLNKSDDNPKTIAQAMRWLKSQEAEVAQPSLF